MNSDTQSGIELDDSCSHGSEYLGLVSVAGKYRLQEQIAVGSFSVIYCGTNVITNENIAIKFESVDVEDPQLEYENKIYQGLAGVIGVPSIHWFGTEGNYNAMVQLKDSPSSSRPNAQISHLEHIHSHHVVHGDVKLMNFVMGVGNHEDQVYIIDFGLARMYRSLQTHQHIPYKENHHPTGTTTYTSINNHLGVERSHHNDMESFTYILLYFLHGSLPWFDVEPSPNQQQCNTILEQKMCLPLNFPGAKPDYTYLRKLFHNLLIREGHQSSHPFAQCIMSNIPIVWKADTSAKNDKQKVHMEKDTGYGRVLHSHACHDSFTPNTGTSSPDQHQPDVLFTTFALILAQTENLS